MSLLSAFLVVLYQSVIVSVQYMLCNKTGHVTIPGLHNLRLPRNTSMWQSVSVRIHIAHTDMTTQLGWTARLTHLRVRLQASRLLPSSKLSAGALERRHTFEFFNLNARVTRTHHTAVPVALIPSCTHSCLL